MIRYILNKLGYVVIPKKDYNILRQAIHNVTDLYDSVSGDSYHHFDATAKVRLSELGTIHVAKNVLNKVEGNN